MTFGRRLVQNIVEERVRNVSCSCFPTGESIECVDRQYRLFDVSLPSALAHISTGENPLPSGRREEGPAVVLRWHPKVSYSVTRYIPQPSSSGDGRDITCCAVLLLGNRASRMSFRRKYLSAYICRVQVVRPQATHMYTRQQRLCLLPRSRRC